MKSRLATLIDNLQTTRIAVLGDYLLDEFVFGEISRVSREAPVLILSYQESRVVPGGGANTVAGVDCLGAEVIPVGFLGQDETGDRLLEAWAPRINRDHLVRDARFRTTRKTRILAGSFHSFRQQVVRIDHESPLSLSEDDEFKSASALEEIIPQVDGLILSDYSLGNVTPRLRETGIRLARENSIPVVVDSRFDPAGFKGATAITPNITEVETAIRRKIGQDCDLLERIGEQLRKDWQLKALLVTRGRLGMSLFEDSGVTHIPIFGTDEVVDVTGAGDTVIATFTTALASGAEFKEAAVLANIAGGIVVTKKGTATVSADELRAAVRELE